jgi:hypothetical protein
MPTAPRGADKNPFTDPTARRSYLARQERQRGLSETDRDLIRLANEPGFTRWLELIRGTGGCAHPVYLAGHTTTVDAATGEVLHRYTTDDEPGGRLPVRCRNRRASRCPSCSYEHQGDTYHLVRAGLSGGKGVPATVRRHPALFITLTAPSFGPVHRATPVGQRCLPRRAGGLCEHGRPVGCGRTHTDTDPLVGQPLCPACYDYPHHVLWHAHTRELWDRFTRNVRRRLAAELGLTQAALSAQARVAFAKVAEYQRRGAVHFHAVVRLDGPEGPHTDPPSWATAGAVTDAVRLAASGVRVTVPWTAALGELVLRWGSQLDVRPLRSLDSGQPLTDDAVAAYIAKYTTKSVGDAGGTDHRIHHSDEIPLLPVNNHIRTLIATCWRLGALPELGHLRLRPWAHTLGYRGHCLSKSRNYSTTYGVLRAQRVEFRRHDAGLLPRADVVVDAAWRYVGSGHTPGASLIAADIAEDRGRNREAAKTVSRCGDAVGP